MKIGMLRNRVTLAMDKTGVNSSAQRQTAVTGTLPTTGIMVSYAEECTDERELARAVVRAEAILVASRSLSATFCLCFFLYFSVGSHSCGCSASTVSFRVECDEGSAMTGTQRHCWPEWCCSVLETLAETAVRRGTTCSELFVVRCRVDTIFDVRWRRRDRTCGGDRSPVEGSRASRVSWSSETDYVRATVLEGDMATRLSWSCWRCAVGSRFGGRQKLS